MMETVVFKPSIKINHPLATSISVQDSQFHYSTPGKSSEVAFFKDGKFVTQLIEPFSQYADAEVGDTLVYGWVPNELINEFLEEFEA
jgi:hypothetical protein